MWTSISLCAHIILMSSAAGVSLYIDLIVCVSVHLSHCMCQHFHHTFMKKSNKATEIEKKIQKKKKTKMHKNSLACISSRCVCVKRDLFIWSETYCACGHLRKVCMCAVVSVCLCAYKNCIYYTLLHLR